MFLAFCTFRLANYNRQGDLGVSVVYGGVHITVLGTESMT